MVVSPKSLYKVTSTSSNQTISKVFSEKSVIQNITFHNHRGAGIDIDVQIFKEASITTPSENNRLFSLNVTDGQTLVLDNLRWVFEQNEVLAFIVSQSDLNIFVNGVEII